VTDAIESTGVVSRQLYYQLMSGPPEGGCFQALGPGVEDDRGAADSLATRLAAAPRG